MSDGEGVDDDSGGDDECCWLAFVMSVPCRGVVLPSLRHGWVAAWDGEQVAAREGEVLLSATESTLLRSQVACWALEEAPSC